MTFELLHLLFLWYLALHSLRNDFWAENLLCAPLGTTFCSFVMLCIPLGMSFELLPVFFLFALDGASSDFTYYIFGGFWPLYYVGLNKNEKLQAMGPLKTFLPSWKEKGAIEKMKKNYIKLHIASPKLIRIPRSGYVIAVHILQPVRTGSWRRYNQKRTFPLQL